MSTTIGIDLGTSNTVRAVCIAQTQTIVPNAEGHRSSASVVGSDGPTGKTLVGAAAKRQAALNPPGTIFTGKRLMGRTFDELDQYLKHLPYEVVRSPGGDAHVRTG
jgi:molecular chaperone DnaK